MKLLHIKYNVKNSVIGLLCAVFLIVGGLPAPVNATQVGEEEAIDRQLGILKRPWKINLIRINTKDYLRSQAQIKTGLPAFDQQVEHAQQSPAVFYESLTSPKKTSSTNVQPISTPPSPSPQPNPEVPPDEPVTPPDEPVTPPYE